MVRTAGLRHLRLPAPRSTSIRACTCGHAVSMAGQRLSTLGQPPPRLTNGRRLCMCHVNHRTCSPAAPLRNRLFVSGEVEDDEEEEVRGEDANSGDGGEFLASALAGVGEPRPVGTREVGVGGEVDEAWEIN